MHVHTSGWENAPPFTSLIRQIKRYTGDTLLKRAIDFQPPIHVLVIMNKIGVLA